MNMLINTELSLKSKEPLSRHSSFRIGGPAKFFAEPETCEGLKQLLVFANRENLPWITIGRGSNLVFSDKGYSGLVISMARFMREQIKFEGDELEVSCGAALSGLLLRCQERGFGGLEFLAGIPGTVGGALVQNAGISHEGSERKEIGECVISVLALNQDGELVSFERDKINFGYRHSIFKDGNFILISCKLKGCERLYGEIEYRMKTYLEYRFSRHDLSYPSAGSVFRNPDGFSQTAGELIDKAGLKGYRVGGAEVSNKHANFIVNKGGAQAADVLALTEHIRSEVRKKFDIALETEIEFVEHGLTRTGSRGLAQTKSDI